MRYVITGGAGFLGSHLARRLLDEGHHVHLLDCKRNEANLRRAAGATFQLCDVRRTDAMPVGVDFVFHFAAKAGVPYLLDREHDLVTENLAIDLAVVDACRRLPTLSDSGSVCV